MVIWSRLCCFVMDYTMASLQPPHTLLFTLAFMLSLLAGNLILIVTDIYKYLGSHMGALLSNSAKITWIIKLIYMHDHSNLLVNNGSFGIRGTVFRFLRSILRRQLCLISTRSDVRDRLCCGICAWYVCDAVSSTNRKRPLLLQSKDWYLTITMGKVDRTNVIVNHFGVATTVIPMTTASNHSLHCWSHYWHKSHIGFPNHLYRWRSFENRFIIGSPLFEIVW